MKIILKFVATILITLILVIPAFAEPAKSNRKIEHRFYEGCTIDQVKEAARIAFTYKPLKCKAPLATFSQKWTELPESITTSEPKIAFTYKKNCWIGKLIQKDNGVEAYWIFQIAVDNFVMNSVLFGTFVAGIAATNGKGYTVEIKSAPDMNVALGYVLEQIEVELKLRDELPKAEKKEPEETEDAQQE